MLHISDLDKSESTLGTLRKSLTKIISKITAKLIGGTIDNDEIEDLKFQLI